MSLKGIQDIQMLSYNSKENTDNCSFPLPSEHPCSSMVSLWLLIIISSLVINQLHLHTWGPAAKAMPWYERLPQNVTPALLTVRQL